MALILFDLDGTLIDSEIGITRSMQHALRALDVEPPSQEILRSWIGPPLHASFPTVLGDDDARVDLAVDHYRERFNEIGWSEHSVYPDIADLIARLAAHGNQLAVVTSKIEDQARRIVDNLPFGHHFDAIYGPAMGVRASEKAALVARALSELDGSPDSTVMIGDRRFDIEGARANGVYSIGVLWGFGGLDELCEAGADSIAMAPSDLEKCLEGCLRGYADRADVFLVSPTNE
ncbi:MAG: HAD hydrolase-like protein [Dokdonella sp.]